MKDLIRQNVTIMLIVGLILVLLGTAVVYRYRRYVLNAAFLYYARPQADKLPRNNPASCTPKEIGQKRVVFVGDSITMGTVSVNYIDLLAQQLDNEAFELINAGVNSQLAYNVLQRLDEVIACDPDFVFVLIGTNDLNAVALAENAEAYARGQNLPQSPSPKWYRENLTAIATRLKEQTFAEVALLSLPPLGEQIDSEAYQLSTEYSEIVKEVAADTAVSYLPLHESMTDYLTQQSGTKQGYSENWNELVVNSMYSHFLYKQSLDKVSEQNGYLLLTDSIHLNTTGAQMIVDLTLPILEEE